MSRETIDLIGWVLAILTIMLSLLYTVAMNNYSDLSGSHGFSPSKFAAEDGTVYVFSHYAPSGCMVYVQESMLPFMVEHDSKLVYGDKSKSKGLREKITELIDRLFEEIHRFFDWREM